MKVYDVFADEYIDESDIDPIAPPERYMEITEELIVKNAVRWLVEELNDAEKGDDQIAHWIPNDKIESKYSCISYGEGYGQCSVCKKITFLAVTKKETMKYCPWCGVKMVGVSK